jgi:antirestriction protein
MTHEFDRTPPNAAERTDAAAEPDEATVGERATTPDAETPRLWIGSLSDYNNGLLHGSWIDATQSAADIQQAITSMLEKSPTMRATGQPAEEWAIFDSDNFHAYRVEEYDDLDWVTAVAAGIDEHGPAFAAWASLCEHDSASLAQFEEAYLGIFASLDAYAETLIEDLGYYQLLDDALPENLRPYVSIDTAMLARDLQLSGDITTEPAAEGGVYLFDGRLP